MKICVINTGGTISSVGDPLGPMSAAEFGQASQTLLGPIIADAFPDTTVVYESSLQFPESSTHTLDSTNLQPSDWVLMAEFILANYTGYDGFVVLHGTDSMDFTASALPFLLNVVDSAGVGTAVLSKPVIVTGSQVPMYYQNPTTKDLQINFNTDAFQNVCGAIASARLGVPEVGLYFDAKLYRGNRSLKVNASEFEAFATPNYPALGTYGITLDIDPDNFLPGPVHESVSLDNDDARALATEQLTAIKAGLAANPVMQFNAFPAAYNTTASTAVIADLIGACLTARSADLPDGIKGLVLESYGEGNFPSGNPDNPEEGEIYKTLAGVRDDVVVLDATQVIAGTVNDSAYASGAWLPSAGVVSSADMTPMAGLAKLTILLAAAGFNGWKLDDVRRLLQLNLQGEMMNVNRMDSRTNATLLPGQSIRSLNGSAVLVNDPLAGIQLRHGSTVLWTPGPQVPVRLEMQNDGNLVSYDADNTPVWASQTNDSGGASTLLSIDGSAEQGTLSLTLVDYSGGATHTLYQQGQS